MAIILEDWRNSQHCGISYFDNLDTAEQYAIDLMNGIKHLFPSQSWQRCEWSQDTMEYAERPAIGSCRIYVRIIRDGIPRICQVCKGNDAQHAVRAGNFCNECYAVLDK